MGLEHQAIVDFTKAIELVSNYLAVRYYRGVIHRELGNVAKSNYDFARAKSIQDALVERSISLDETRLYAEGLALYYTGHLEAARTTLNLATLHAKQSENHRFHARITLFIKQDVMRKFPYS